MGKKTRPAVGTAVGRRTILQLSPPPGIRVAVGGREEAGSGSEDEQEAEGHPFLKNTMRPPAPAAKAPEGLSLLGAYEDSEDEDSGDNPPPAVKTQLNQSADILANFMAEIDAITTQPSTEDQASSSPPGPEAKAQQPTPEEGEQQPSTVAAVTAFQYDTQYSLAGVGVEMGDWQEVWDDTSGCHYYWNTLTNEVAWELPHYLADQVQGLQQAADRSVVNGNGTTPTTGCVTEPDPASGPELKKEPKKKEVMESVVALRSEEEERCGVAASLLGPLIPSDVKESEEKWRKTLLSLPEAADDEEEEEEDEETSVDSDGEDSVPGSPATPPHEPDALPADTKQLPSRAQSEENSAAEEETEEDTMELELALERKKAELRALEEGDGRSGGSSPCSEASQDASPGPRAVPVKKARWKTAFVLAASPESNSRSSDAPENTDTANCKIPEKLLEADEKEADKMEEKTVTKALVKEEVETPELKFQIGELANTLTSKMEFLEINKKTISNLHLLLLQTETRIADWREGALSGTYLRRRLLEAAEHIKLSELNATPKGWSCHWDREHRRYFYVNDRTSASQWDFPVEEEEEDDEEEEEEEHTKGPPVTQTAGQGEPKPPPSGPTPPSPAPAPPPPAPIPAGVTEWSSFTPVAPADPPQPPLPDSPPPPPPPPASPPPPPPPPDSDGEIMEVEMEMDDDEGEPPAPGTEEDTGGRPPLPVVAKVVESSVPLGKGLKRKAGLPTKAATIGSNAIIYTQPAPAAAAAPVMSASSYWTAMAVPSLPAETPAPPLPPLPSQPPLPSAQPPCDPPGVKTLPTDKTKKLKKDKSKKSKIKMPSLVQKWQSIQKELDEEEKSSSSDEDRTQLNKRNIEDWRKQQLLTGKAGKNANFEALPDNWRERLKKRKMMNNT